MQPKTKNSSYKRSYKLPINVNQFSRIIQITQTPAKFNSKIIQKDTQRRKPMTQIIKKRENSIPKSPHPKQKKQIKTNNNTMKLTKGN